MDGEKKMKILTNLKVPTGNICTVSGEKGLLEFVSLGDYGKEVNIKCDSMGLSRIPKQVTHGKMLPLSEKWVITVSTQYGCSMGCIFCDVPKVGPGINATKEDLIEQVMCGLSLHPEVTRTDRLNIHYARMGEPTFNPNVLTATRHLYYTLPHNIHPVVSTMLPAKNIWLDRFLREWLRIKNEMLGNAGLQLSINSTSHSERRSMFSNNAMDLKHASEMMEDIILQHGIRGRKITLNFAIAGYEIDAEYLSELFPPKHYICKLTPMHKTKACSHFGIKTDGEYTEYFPYAKHEEELKKAGFDVLVFIASKEEDESRITCGNAILSDK